MDYPYINPPFNLPIIITMKYSKHIPQPQPQPQPKAQPSPLHPLQTKLTKQGLQLYLSNENESQLLITSLEDVDGLAKWFDDLEIFQEYLREEGNARVREDGVVEVLWKVWTKKEGTVVIATIRLENKNVEVEPEDKEEKGTITKALIYKKAQNIKEEVQQEVPQAKCVAQLWVDPKINDYWRLIFNDTLAYNKFGTAVVLGTQILNKNPQFTVYTNNFLQFTSIGIIDQTLKYYMPGKKNMISYQNNCYFWGGQKTEQNKGLGYKVHENVTVRVKMDEGIVEWWVGDQLRYRYKTGLFQDRSVVWVPYVFLCDGGDSFRVVL